MPEKSLPRHLRLKGKDDQMLEGLREIYQGKLRKHAHTLIDMGYRKLNRQDYAASQEEDITGELVKSIRQVLECDSPPPWGIYYAVHDDPPLNVSGKQGKHRPRVDIEFERTHPGPRPRFRLEAKRLRKGQDVSSYLGPDGLGCFTSGKYPLTHPEAGMIGYIQSDDESTWVEQNWNRPP